MDAVVGADGHRRPLRRRGIVSPRGSVPEWPKGADCKSAGIAYEGSNPSRPTHPPCPRAWCRSAPLSGPGAPARPGPPGLRGAHLPRGPLSLQCRYERPPPGATSLDGVGCDRSRYPGARTEVMGVQGRTAAPPRGSGLSAPPLVARALDRLTAWDEAVRRRWPFSTLVPPDVEPGAVAGDGSRLLVRPAILGFIAMVSITLGVSQRGSPFVLKQPGAWFFGVPATSGAPSHVSFVGLVAVYGGLVLFIARLVRAHPHARPAAGRARQEAGAGGRAVDGPAARGSAPVQQRHLQLRRPGRDDEPTHQPVPLRPGRARGGPVGVSRRPLLDQHPRALRPAVHVDRRHAHQPVAAPRAHRPGPAPSLRAARRGADRALDPVPRPQRGTATLPTSSPWPCSTP